MDLFALNKKLSMQKCPDTESATYFVTFRVPNNRSISDKKISVKYRGQTEASLPNPHQRAWGHPSGADGL